MDKNTIKSFLFASFFVHPCFYFNFVGTMTENFLYYLWKYKLWQIPLYTVDGVSITVVSSGVSNPDEGPDFLNAKVKIGDTLWAGNVEIHLKSSDWKNHKHHKNDKYRSLILHVVYDNDIELNLNFPTMEIKGKFDEKLLNTYEGFMKSKTWVPCQSLLQEVDEFHQVNWLEMLAIERLESKNLIIAQIVENTANHWEESFYITVARSLGLKVNQQAFEMLARSLPMKILAKHKNNKFQIEALLFGQSGLLNQLFEEKYPRDLQNEYEYLRSKYDLTPLDKKIWHFSKIHPYHFPTLRIAQLADLIFSSSHLLSKVIEKDSILGLKKLFSCQASAFWDLHYHFDSFSENKVKKLGETLLNLMLINAILPFVFHYANMHGNDLLKERMLYFLKALPPEKNMITKKWQAIGLKISDAMQSQASISLKNDYCEKKRCLQCSFGNYLIKRT